MKTFLSHSLIDTAQFAKELIQNHAGKNVLLLQGDLGSGKTALTKKIAHEVGVADEVTSPTFIIMSVYEAAHADFDRLVHVDLYRFDSFSPDQVRELGLGEYLNDARTLAVIEWPERLEQRIEDAVTIKCQVIDEQSRQFTIH